MAARPGLGLGVGGTSFNPVHVYLLTQQGVHILELHNCEDLAADRTYKFAYVLGPPQIKVKNGRHGHAPRRHRLTNPECVD